MYEEKKRDIELQNIKAHQEAQDAMLGLMLNFLTSEAPVPAALRETLRRASAYTGTSRAKQELAKLAKDALGNA